MSKISELEHAKAFLEKDGGPFNPTSVKFGDGSEMSSYGITLRDYFAAQMIVAMGTWMPVPTQGYPSLTSDATLSARAVIAYSQADALIAIKKAGA